MASSSPSPHDEPVPAFKDAEAWLAERGIERDPIDLTVEPEIPVDAPVPAEGHAVADTGATAGTGVHAGPDDAPEPAAQPTELSARDVGRLADQAAADAQLREADAAALPTRADGGLEDDVAEAISFVRVSTSAAPQAEGRVRSKLADRGWSSAVIDATMERARRERLVDDPAMAAALVTERRAKGHAVARIRRDLRERGFDDAVLTVVLGEADQEDPEAAAFAVARDKAASLTGVAAETAFRRVVGYVARRGYPEGLARKVARDAVFAAREEERTAGH